MLSGHVALCEADRVALFPPNRDFLARKPLEGHDGRTPFVVPNFKPIHLRVASSSTDLTGWALEFSRLANARARHRLND